MYVENPRKRDEKPQFEQEWNVLAPFRFVLCEEKRSLLSVRVFFLKERPYFLLFYLINFLLSSSNIYLGSYLKIQLHVPLIIWGIWLSTKTGVKSSFPYFGHFHSCTIICWLEDRNCANVALGPVGRWLGHCLGNSPWILRTSRVLWLIHVSLKWSNMHLTNKRRHHSWWP